MNAVRLLTNQTVVDANAQAGVSEAAGQLKSEGGKVLCGALPPYP